MPKTTIKFWKPYGVHTKFTDPDGRPTLADYIDRPNIYPIGRLDHDSEGLLLISDDKRLTAQLLDPEHGHPRTYWAQVERIPNEATLDHLRAGVKLSIDGKPYTTRPALVELLPGEPDLPPRPVPIRYRINVPTAWLALTITDGKNRQVRRMTAAVGFPTLRLVRVAMAGITLDGLAPGEWRELTAAELGKLKKGKS